jgi:membrane fusion protein, multidrug efflux system
MTPARNLSRVVFGTSIALLFVFFGCAKEKAPSKPLIRPVRTHKVTLASTVSRRTFSGKTKAGTQSNLSFKVNGQLKKIAVRVGDKVKRGQLIAVLDDKDIKLRLRQAQAAYAQAAAQHRNAKASYGRAKKLYENRAVSIKDLDTARAAATSSRAAAAAQAQAVGLVRAQVGYCKLTAPLSGHIAMVPVNVNENIQAGQPVVALTAGDHFDVSFNVPESLIGDVKKGGKAEAIFAALKGKRIPATVTEVGVAAGATAYPVVVRLDNKVPGVRTGMAADVRLVMQEATALKEQILIPASAVMEDDKGRFAFIAKGQPGGVGKIVRKTLTTGALKRQGLAVTSGLSPGDRVVIAGIRFVKEGMTVRILKDL